LRYLLVGGEACEPKWVRTLLDYGPPKHLLNAYGPTESTTFASWYPITDVPEGTLRLPIGTPITNSTLHVLDRHRRVLPPGVPGELFIGGDGLALGYLGDPELTARKFVADPFAGPPHRLYATGDLVTRAGSGEVVFLRRIDDQLKIRGHRVEPLEVAALVDAVVDNETLCDRVLHAQDAALERLRAKNFDGTLLGYIETVLASPKKPSPRITWDFWDQLRQAEELYELQQYRPAIFRALPESPESKVGLVEERR